MEKKMQNFVLDYQRDQAVEYDGLSAMEKKEKEGHWPSLEG